ncbi:MAG: ATP-binding cassette domain-containing protein [Actinomycetia bacterium]|nr:ATP-binding cassette domain-containing protein [Actinomycetes bacterium]
MGGDLLVAALGDASDESPVRTLGHASSVLSFAHVSLQRWKGRQPITVLRDVTFEMAPGARLALVGPSGSGKSSILDLAAGRLVASAGSVVFDGQDLAALDDARRSLNRLTLQGTPRAEALDMAAGALTRVGLTDRASHKPAELSGGERQRVAIARAIVTSPILLLADEPTGSLDAGLRDEMVGLLFEASGTAAVLTVTHDPAVAGRSDQVLRLTDGALYPVARRGL